jgi:nucleotide-binding universal stress UspA family protein
MSQLPQLDIVCATDLSEAARPALDTALELCDCYRAERLHVLHIREITDRIETLRDIVERWDDQQLELRVQVETEIKKVTTARGRAPDVRIITQVRHGKVYREILLYALEVNAGTIVVGTHGRTGIGHAVLGSVAERVVRHAPCNVVVAKSQNVSRHLSDALTRQLAR